MADLGLREIHDYLVPLAREAGEIILQAAQSVSSIVEKQNSTDLVTETDQYVEAFLKNRLLQKFPLISFAFIGEESYSAGVQLTDDPTFIVDPIDGTLNFIHGFPFVACSIGLAVNKTPVVGVVYAPFLDKCYSAIAGEGSWVNEKPLPRIKRTTSTLQQCLVISEFGSDRGPKLDAKCETLKGLLAEKKAMVRGVRATGSAALNFCLVAEGCADLYWELGPWMWDVCAGYAILYEAGGKVVDGLPCQSFEDPGIESRRFLAVRGDMDSVVKEFWEMIQQVEILEQK
ncbi:Inositol monophosphatase 2 [Neolecta irregularis DAH-3]|uniref:Inositol-1-monophosphatase n=1 Tax=Neolecta irregularis (strain DAH-3) TaxID=1198029 RepID=A0A1U7LLC5_NEOID|nr:Inositol monophosphatase 2 [Neolecta irregularis DAH-3]|eukprot:OLL23454.1 Inositol monophosphatase 2 [Neolecta irregularis DAH-3]